MPKKGDEAYRAVALHDGAADRSGAFHMPLVYTPDDKTSVNALGVPPELNVVCKCEKVTEAEVRRRRPPRAAAHASRLVATPRPATHRAARAPPRR